ncbi:ribosome recycling factor [Patescibacteria group bacterium]|nr:ribosome recycling factor [Patescibacteria group bacterium]
MPSITDYKTKCQNVIASLKEDLKSIRTGRATPSLIENIVVEAYGGSTKLRLTELATITTEGPTALVIAPFDPSILSDIEKAILKSPLGLSPAVQGNRIIIKIPPLSTEQREKFIKIASSKVEEKRNQLRGLRDEVRKSIKASFEKKEISEDEKYRFEKEVDTVSQQQMAEIETIKEKKEAEIIQV